MTQEGPQMLRLKRPRTAAPPASFRVIPPAKRVRLSAAFDSLTLDGADVESNYVRYRRVSAEEAERFSGRAGVVDVDMACLKRGRKRGAQELEESKAEELEENKAEEGGKLTCNGEEMIRGNAVVFDWYVREVGDGSEEMYVLAEDLPEFDWGESDEVDEEDPDGQSIDYPSTPDSGIYSGCSSAGSGRRRFGVLEEEDVEELVDEVVDEGEWSM